MLPTHESQVGEASFNFIFTLINNGQTSSSYLKKLRKKAMDVSYDDLCHMDVCIMS